METNGLLNNLARENFQFLYSVSVVSYPIPSVGDCYLASIQATRRAFVPGGETLVRADRIGHRQLEEDRKLFLHAYFAAAVGKVEATGDLNGERGGEDRILAEEIDLDLHRLAEETGDIDVVPRLLVVAAGR